MGDLPQPGRRVVKLGGSLLQREDLVGRVVRLLDDLPPAGSTLIVVGGGAPVREIQKLQASLGADDESAHWAAIDAMSANARLFAAAAALPLFELGTGSPPQGVSVALLAAWLRTIGPDRLPRNWSVTSDSIAAALAAETGAELVLCKSTPPPATTLLEAAKLGYVDEFFPAAAHDLRQFCCVNLTTTPPFARAAIESEASYRRS